MGHQPLLEPVLLKRTKITIKRRMLGKFNRLQCLRRWRYNKPQAMPNMTPMISISQSLMSAPRLNLGCISSRVPPKALALIKRGSKPKRPVRAKGKTSAEGNDEQLYLRHNHWKWPFQGPQHCGTKYNCHDYRQGNV